MSRGGAISLIEGKREFRHLLLVVAQVAEGGIVWGPGHRAIRGKLLLIGPVGDTVYHLVGLAVFSHGHLRVIVDFLDVDIVARHERHHAAIRREERGLLQRELLGKRPQYVAFDFKHMPVGLEGMAVNRSLGCVQQYLGAIRAQDEALYRLHGAFTRVAHIKHSLQQLAGGRLITFDGLAVVAQK